MLREVLYGVAVADAIGNPLEFKQALSAKDFKDSVTRDRLVVSDDTQMMMFSLESLIHGWGAERACLRWYRTQTSTDVVGVGLLSYPVMFDVQSPGNTCMNSCRDLQKKIPVKNDSKGNGTVMRCAHIAHWARHWGLSLENALALARTDAETTHKHPLAASCSVILTHIHWCLGGGRELPDAVAVAANAHKMDLPAWVVRAITELLIESGYGGRNTLDSLRGSLGGWVAEEALVLAIGASLSHEDFLDAVYDATMIAGDSDTVGAITGGLMAAKGVHAPKWLVDSLNVKEQLDILVSWAGCS